MTSTANTTTRTNPKDATMSTTEQLEAARTAAAEAAAHANALQAQADATEAARKAERDEAMIEFNRARKLEWKTTYGDKIKERRTNFENTVTTGGNTIGAWIEYQTIIHAAAQEEGRFTHALYEHAMQKYDAVAAQVNAWNQELQHLATSSARSTPPRTVSSTSGEWWTGHVPGLTSSAMEEAAKAKTRLEQINAQITAVTKSLGIDLNRTTDSVDWLHVQDFATKPSNPSVTTGETEKWERRTMTQAVQEIIEAKVKTEAAKLSNNRAAEFEQFMKNHKS